MQFDVCRKRDSKSLIVMTVFHKNAILGEPGAAQNSFSGSSPSRLSDPDNEVGAGSRDKKNRRTPVKPLLVSEFHKHLNFTASRCKEKQFFWPVGKYAAL